MKKIYILEELDCANCAAKIEEGINKLDGVNKATVSFLSKKLILDAEDAKMDTVVAKAKKLIKKLEPDVEMIAK